MNAPTCLVRGLPPLTRFSFSIQFTFSQVQHTHTLRMRNVTEIALTTSNMGNLCLLLTHTHTQK